MTHVEHAKRVGPSRPCGPQDMNFGGGCFNCGYSSNKGPDYKKDVPQAVRESDFGCLNCLWAGVECKGGDKYREGTRKDTGKPFCVAYSYYD